MLRSLRHRLSSFSWAPRTGSTAATWRIGKVGFAFVLAAPPVVTLIAVSGRRTLLEKEIPRNGEPALLKEMTSAVDHDGPMEFDLVQLLKSLDAEISAVADVWNTIVESEDKIEPNKTFQNVALAIMSLMSDKRNEKQTQTTLNEIVAQVREKTEQGELHDETSIHEVLKMLRKYSSLIQTVAEKFIARVDFSKLTPATLIYYLEHEDERKNPSWKNRVHRFCPGIDIDKIEELNSMLDLAHLAYAETAEEIGDGLLKASTPSAMVYCNMKSEPGKPAHFIAVRTDQPSSVHEPLEVIMGVRGTKSLVDTITDILCNSDDYRDGKAHQFIVKSGDYLFRKHLALLEELARKSGRSKIKLTLVGHSLGAGAASIAGIEFNALENFEVQVYGFGCPALLSKELAEQATFITTVINDGDVIPRASAATVTNLFLSLMEFDWLPYYKRDLRYTLAQLKCSSPFVTDDFIEKVLHKVEPLIDTHMQKFIKQKATSRIPTDLCPPGQLIHLYYDGLGVSGCYVPNDFFQEIDVTRRMVEDHLIHSGYKKIFLDIVRQHKGDHHFRFETLATDA